MASRLDSSLVKNQTLEGSICEEAFRSPKVLNCFHTFCKSCIQSWIIKLTDDFGSNLSGIECPLCRKISKPPTAESKPEDWAKQLPNNFALLPILESVKMDKKLNKKDKLCDPCSSENESTKAVAYCVICEEKLCHHCRESHKKLKLTKAHKVIDIKEVDTLLPEIILHKSCLMCELHPDKDLEFYCHDDEDIFCGTCAFLKHRGCDDVVEIKTDENLEYDGPTPLAMSRQMKVYQKYLGQVVVKRQEYGQMIDNDLETLGKDLKNVREVVLKKIKLFEEKCMKNAHTLHNDLQANNEARIIECNNITKALGVSISNTNIAQKSSAAEYFIICTKVQKQLQEVKGNIEKESESLDEFIGISFEQNKSILALLSTSEYFGSVSQPTKIISFPCMPEPKPLIDCKLEYVRAITRKYAVKNMPIACTFHSDEVLAIAENKHLTICDMNSSIINEIRFKLPVGGICSLNKEEIAVTVPAKKKLMVFDVTSEIKLKQEISTNKKPAAIQSLRTGEIAVTVSDNEETEWQLVIFNKEGVETNIIDMDADGRGFETFWNLRINEDVVYQPCQKQNALFAFKLDAQTPRFEYRSKDLKVPGGVDIDADRNVYVCGIVSRNIHILSSTGSKLRITTLSQCGPANIMFSDNDEEMVVVGTSDRIGPFLYKFKM